ncbi:MAG: aminoacetone oxidase family FAD-binding enzyme, partial [Proteobacteria bacterium]
MRGRVPLMDETLGPPSIDVIVLGAGGAGMMCALTAGGFGKRVLILDHMKQAGGKILISGGGRCNFTNLGATSANYVSKNPHFMKSAMSRYTPQDFIALVEKHQVPYHEKKLGQQFCDNRAKDIVDLLVRECLDVGVKFEFETQIKKLLKEENGFRVVTSRGDYWAPQVVNCLGGLSLPKVGATGVGFELARRFGHTIIETAPALDGFTWNDSDLKRYQAMAGVSFDCVMTAGKKSFRENLLFTHGGLSGPASLQASLHWNPGEKVHIQLLPDLDLKSHLLER